MDEVRIPDIEIIVGASGNDIAVFCFYAREDIHQGYDVVAGISGKDALPAVRTVLRDALTALDQSDWFTVDELHSLTVSGEDTLPF